VQKVSYQEIRPRSFLRSIKFLLFLPYNFLAQLGIRRWAPGFLKRLSTILWVVRQPTHPSAIHSNLVVTVSTSVIQHNLESPGRRGSPVFNSVFCDRRPPRAFPSPLTMCRPRYALSAQHQRVPKSLNTRSSRNSTHSPRGRRAGPLGKGKERVSICGICSLVVLSSDY